MRIELLFILPNSEEISANYGGNGTWWAVHKFDDYGVYEVNASYTGLDNVTVNNGTITINKPDSTIMLDDITLNFGESKNVTVTTTGATEITASINGTDVTVINNYTIPISGLAVGNYTLNVTTVPDGDHNSVSKEVKIIVYKATAEITVDSATMDIKVLDEVLSGATLTPADAGNLTYKSNNETVVIVKDGKIKALAKGTATITVSFAGNENYTATKNKTISVTVTLKDAIISVNNSTLNLFVDDNFTVVASTNPDGLNVTFVQDDSGVYIVDENGNITALREGTGNILVKVGGDGVYAENSTTVAVTVSKIPAEITLTNTTLDLKVGDEVKVNATLTPSEAGELDFTSSDVSVVTVNGIGELTAVGEGIANITVRFLGDDKYVASNATVAVTVNKQDTNVNVSIPENITVGDNSTIDVVLPSDAMGDVTVKVDGEVVDSVAVKDGSVDVTIPSLSAGNHTVEISYSGDGKYNPVNETKEITVYKKDTLPEIIIPSDIAFGDNATVDVKLPSDAEGNVTLTVDGKIIDTVTVTNGTASVKLPELNVGNHTVEIAYSGDDKYKSASKNTTVNIAKDSTKLTADDVTATYKVDKYLVITLTDSKGNPLTNATVTVELSVAKNYTTDENGQVKVKVSNMLPKTYTAKISFAGNGNYLGCDDDVKVVVKKATPKITANAKTFKTTTKTKKYTITLKDNDGKAIKKGTVYLKVGGKTYKATTNSQGNATFKITKLNNKGTYKATVTYKGNKYYNKETKKVTIKVKSVWKTVSKGSKESAIVKKIQRALKNHGYYLEYNDRYLMVDGIYWDYTEMAVKEFQYDKVLKVTGKVDEKTAKKLGII
ncbi:Ig-like domain repeat protein [Methanobrevibacter sp.]|uniref:Ig-like domain repeat protein n=1 Tax=Methanobrevibacter sp. TaxID=66852 RepID=UPI0025E06727|nr:Ig-like domain repeat protein [Methanobrevibacter sp.]MBQ2831108.1 Ig-like domain repeat protein [Methanobrevibacter sp.]